MEKPPFLETISPAGRFIILILIVIISLLITLLLGVILAFPFYGSSILNLSTVQDYTNPAVIKLLKYFQIISQFGFLIFPALIFAYLSEKNFSRFLQISSPPFWLSSIITLFIILVSIPFINWMLEINQYLKLPGYLAGLESWMKQSEESAAVITRAFLNTGSIGGLMVNLLMIAILPAVGEEFLFRGALLRLFREWTKNAHVAVILSALLFSGIHLQFYGFIPRFMLGVLLGYLFIWTGNLWIPILAHFINNVTTVVAAFLFQRGLISTDYESIGNKSSVSAVIISILLTGLLLWVLFTGEKRRHNSHLITQ